MTKLHEVGLSEPWQLLHTWPVPALLNATDDTDGRARAGVPANAERLRPIAGLGAWECDLRDNSLNWTASVFDLFGLPHDATVERGDAVARYSDESREAMELLRAYAIRHRRGFTMDARLVRPDGEERWMRLSAAVDCDDGRPQRLYGTKQDITREQNRRARFSGAPDRDACTGLSTRAAFEAAFLNAHAGTLHGLGALVIVRIGGIASIERRFGAAAGEACLAALASRLALCLHNAVMAARISEREFAVLLPATLSRSAIDRAVRRLLSEMAEPIYWQGYLLHVVATAGTAHARDPAVTDIESLNAVAMTRLQQAGGAETATTPGAVSLR